MLSRVPALAGANVTAVWNDALSGFAASMSPAAAFLLALDPAVESIQPDRVKEVQATQPIGDPDLWGLDRIDTRCVGAPCGLRGSYVYGSSGANVTAYVVDTGVRGSHREFRRTNGTSRVLGLWNFTGDGRDFDRSGHGTSVAATLAGNTYGVAKQSVVRPAKVCTVVFCLDSWIITGLNWIAAEHTAGRAVANLSFGEVIGPQLDAVDRAVQGLVRDGVTVVVASGNESAPGSRVSACNVSPAHVPEAITVSASDVQDQDAPFSNGGPCTFGHAPGIEVKTATSVSDTAFETVSGTSIAAPYVAGCIARVLQPRALTPAQVKTWLVFAATPGAVGYPYGQVSGSPNRLLFCPPSW
jgi:subtilisin family serine protease